MKQFAAIVLILLLAISCVPQEVETHDGKEPNIKTVEKNISANDEKNAKKLCSYEQMILNTKCAKEHGPITIDDEKDNTEKFQKYTQCNAGLGDVYKKCFAETITAIEAGKPAPVLNRIKKLTSKPSPDKH